jgi:hypothetical protein
VPVNFLNGDLKIWENMGKYGKIWENMGKYGKIWENMGKYGKIWENMGKGSILTITLFLFSIIVLSCSADNGISDQNNKNSNDSVSILGMIALSQNSSDTQSTASSDDSENKKKIADYQEQFVCNEGSLEGAGHFFTKTITPEERVQAIESMNKAGLVSDSDLQSFAHNSDAESIQQNMQVILSEPQPVFENLAWEASSTETQLTCQSGNAVHSKSWFSFCSTTLICTVGSGLTWDVGPDFWYGAVMCSILDYWNPGDSVLRYQTSCNGSISVSAPIYHF